MTPDDDVLVVDLDDEDDEEKAADSGGDVLQLPPITNDMAAQAIPQVPGFEIMARCGATGQPFVVRFQETAPGIWNVVGTQVVAETKTQAAPAGDQQAMGTFSLDKYPGCPACGSEGLVRCDHCGTAMCGGALDQSKTHKGQLVMRCPTCNSVGRLAGAVQSATGTVRGKKG